MKKLHFSDTLSSFWTAAKTLAATRSFRFALAVVLCLLATGMGIGVRRAVLNAQRPSATAEVAAPALPFTLESALAFRRVVQCYRDGALPAHDAAIEYPVGIDPVANDTAGAAPVYAFFARHWPGARIPLEERLRWLSLLWWALSLPALYLAVRIATRGSDAAAAMATALYAVALAAVARTTGQELSHENDAWPLLLSHVACWLTASMPHRPLRWRAIWGSLGAVALAAALCLWDLVQYYLGAVALFAALRALVGRLPKREAWAFHLPLLAAVLLVSVLDPYHRAHHLLFSPLVALMLATPLSTFVHSRPAPPLHAAAPDAAPRHRTFLFRLGILALLPALAALISLLFFRAEAYGHFFSLFVAKLRFLNVRPLDPARLTFNQRILWTPALNSTDSLLLFTWFPALLVPSTLAAVLAFWPRAARFLFDVPPPPPRDLADTLKTAAPLFVFLGPLTPTFLASFHLLNLLATLLFFRFHIFLALTACILTALLLRRIAAPGPWRGVRTLIAVLLFALVFLAEASQTLTDSRRWGHQNPYLKETDLLVDALRRDVTPDPVLATFGVSASIATYADCPILLQPKFESPAVRRNTEAFWTALFKGDEDAFAAFMTSNGIPVYVHSMGQLSTLGWELSPRYMVDALEPATNAVVRLFEANNPERQLKRFVPVYANRKYRIFRLRPDPDDPASPAVALADRHASAGFQALAEGAPAAALAHAQLALRLYPDSPSAQGLMRALTPEQRELTPDEDVLAGR